ncbi:hypothetical protein SLEP1_g52902 [Rubroshorea leprosula]|uniref:Uncharacterized protein n=1 Tax=Rubroshorea leprosula TaxID=152421 RepID=A0AAV5M9H2_9ROSI|nr:hypothetical protein SLEP1_g52902 [Rubroshorea leprosula]
MDAAIMPLGVPEMGSHYLKNSEKCTRITLIPCCFWGFAPSNEHLLNREEDHGPVGLWWLSWAVDWVDFASLCPFSTSDGIGEQNK